jgi:ATP-dependent RNA helicase RhlE
MKFERYNIAPEIKKRIGELVFKKPTDIQYKTIPSVLKGEDVLAIAQTGTGKTAAYVIPIIDKIHHSKTRSRQKGIQCLVMVPTRELAVQITDVFNSFAKYTKVKTISVYGGVEQDAQIEKLSKSVDVLIATPGRMFDLISQGFIDLNYLRYLVIDEADLMLSRGFYKDIMDVRKKIPKGRQTLFFSATIDHDIKKLAYSLVTNPIRIQISPKDPVSKNVSHFYLNVEMDHKRHFLEHFARENPDKKILVFARTKVRVERISKAMERVGINAITLHGDKDQSNRLNILEKFKKSKIMLLIATDVSSRGIDIPNVSIVINYDLPDEPDTYVHRIGRTGRGRKQGLAYSFVSSEEQDKLSKIEKYITKPIERIKIDKMDYEEIIDNTNPESISMDDIYKMVVKNEQKRTRKN